MSALAIQAVTAPVAPGKNRKAGQAAEQQPAIARDSYLPGRFTVERAVEANVGALHLLWRAAKRVVKHPVQTLAGFAHALTDPFLHPVATFKDWFDTYKKDGWLEALLNSSLYISTVVGLLAVAALGVAAVVGAPAVTAVAGTVFTICGIHDAYCCTMILIKDEYDALAATTREDLDREEAQLADDFLNTAFAWWTKPMNNAPAAATIVPQGLVQAGRDALKPASRGAMHGVKEAVGRGARVAERTLGNAPSPTAAAARVVGAAVRLERHKQD